MKNLTLLASLGLVGACAGFANAVDTVDVQGVSASVGQGVSVTGHSGYAGQIGLSLTNSTLNGLNGSWTAYCTEIDQNISIGGSPQSYQVLNVADLPIPGAGMGSVRADAIGRMWYAAGGAEYSGNTEFAAAFQVAIWEIYHDYNGTAASLDLSAGSFQASGGIDGNIPGYIASLFAAANGAGPMANLIGLGSLDYQDQLIEVPGNIPAPGALALLGAAGLVGFRRRTR